MKPKKFTSLFFCTLFLVSSIIIAQEKTDSLEYYKEIHDKSNKFDELVSAFNFFNNDKEYYLEQKFYERVLYDLYYISSIQHKLGELYDSQDSAIEGLEILDLMPKDSIAKERKEGYYNQLGILKRELRDYDESLNYYAKAFKLSKTKWDTALAYNNISVVHIYLKEYDSAKVKLLKSVDFFEELKDSSYLALAINNLGLVQSKLNEENSLFNLKRALEIRKKINDSKTYESYKYIVDYYKDRNNLKDALYYAEKGYEIAKANNNRPYKEDILSYLVDLNANKYFSEYKALNDSIKSDRLLADNKYGSYKYDYSIEEEKRKNAELEEEKAKTQNILLLFGIVLIVLGSGFFFYILKNRHKKEKLKTRFETERYISKKLHDEVANDMYSMMSKLDNDPNVQKQLVDDLEEVYLKTRDISKAHAALDFSQDYDELLKDLISIYKTNTVNIFTRNISKIPWDSTSDIKKETLYRVIQELMTNMKKHSEASLVTLQFEEQKKKILVTYRDNGIGCELKFGNGLRNTENRIDLAGCTITFESEINKGFQANLII